MKQLFTPKINGFLVANLVALTILGITMAVASSSDGMSGKSNLYIFSEFVIIPMLIGIISASFWRNLNLNSRKLTSYSFYNTMIAVFLSGVFLEEGVICLIIVSPLLWVFTLAGTFLGRKMFRKNNQKLNISIVSLMLAVFIADARSEHHYENEVSDVVVINAPVAEVWQHVVAFKRIEEKNKYWLFKAGLPSPVEATVDGYHVGAGRKCIFSNGYVFDEKIVTYDENRNLTFDITRQPRDPEIMGHIDILRGQFILKDNGDNTTTLIGNSSYRLYVFPVWYYDTWAQSIVRNVHLRVMAHIKQLSENK
ncbi:SRPBCC family protein [Mucilaginibacter sp. Bleaf8]|uniref:SRPBCC family protein n=1 Tax=Mucilaginibacter sp. Bleaf8 TaxID=2834430 RepID=UPI001BCAE791|nr:SRPBCC family protein [Mucilaginibacter sp. Bleaf8]MBS7563742.1 SRPBCC family protein [Mucilaginibacter sp. Bleaf8]